MTHRFPVRVYYEDTDFSGAVYHASYLRFMERARTEMLREAGLNQQDIFAGKHGAPFGFAVRRMNIEFLAPAQMDDVLSVETLLLEMRGASFELDQKILRDGALLVAARVTIACIAQGRAVRIPQWVREKLNPAS
ncbi:MAG: tol-pal system-associated acyl-CoA thioesterase [Alphaproteobacteria bacterium]|nr:tol-pal system-associated acyl-CoA thioesterase [Alphaproteobacteria bacterium]